MALAAIDAAVGTALQSGLRKAQLRILPLLGIGYLIAFMDRANISFAAESMNRQLHFSAQVYGLGSGLFFVSYALCEIPSNKMLLRFGARRWLARIMLTWGLLAATMVLVRTTHEFYGARLLLGCAEAGYFPGAVFFLAQWFPKGMRGRAMALFYVSLPISTILMGGVAGALLRLNGRMGLAGWQWMFLMEALPAVVLSGFVWFTLPDTVAGAKWLTADERDALSAELAAGWAEDPHSQTERRGLLGVALRSPKVWMMGAALFFGLGAVYALTFSLPQLLSITTGWDTGHVGYLVAGSGVVGAVLMLLTAWHSDARGERRWHICAWLVVMAICPLVAGLHLAGWVAAMALLLMMMSWYAVLGPLASVQATLVPGEAAAIALAAVNMMGIAGGFAGPYWMGWMREATGSYAWGVGALCLPGAACCAGMLWLLRGERNSEVVAVCSVEAA